MSLMKDMVARGMHYTTMGITSYGEWSRKMLEAFGNPIALHLKEIRTWSLTLPYIFDGVRAKLNCWEFMGCGLEVPRTSLKIFHSRPCPVSVETNLDSLHGGKNAGRACWVVLHTKCYGEVQNTYEQKFETCPSCDFYRSVIEEEANNILALMHHNGV